MEKFKTFLDSVHGYITVPEEYCRSFIDTINFQRLRRIEQLSSRSLFPCARHDRFVHSLGVFHIGRKIVETIKGERKDLEASIEYSFLIACLLHDVGHAPFSHTLEEYFGSKNELFNKYKEALKKRSENDVLDNINIEDTDAKQHEIISALLCVTTYFEAIKKNGASPSLVGRMIMGLTYGVKEKSLEDCFISLLNGKIIDADKLDYICRDRWASGYLNNSVDVERIIRFIILYEQESCFQIAYSKSALYEIQALVENKNFQDNWIFKHHQVIYEQKIFKDAIRLLVKCLPHEGLLNAEQLFNYKSFYEEVEVCPGIFIYMLSDDDIIHLMKVYKNQIACFEEWMSRQYKYTPVWKTYSEMIALLGKDLSDKIMINKGEIYDDIIAHLKKKFKIDAFGLECTPRIKRIEKGQALIYFNENNIVDFTELGMPEWSSNYNDRIFKYIFVEKASLASNNLKREDIIGVIKDFSMKYRSVD